MAAIHTLYLINCLDIPFAELALQGHVLIQDNQQGRADALVDLLTFVYTGRVATHQVDGFAFAHTYLPTNHSWVVLALNQADQAYTLAFSLVNGEVRGTLIQHTFEQEFFFQKDKPIKHNQLPKQLRSRKINFEEVDLETYRSILAGEMPQYASFSVAKGTNWLAISEVLNRLNLPASAPRTSSVSLLLADQSAADITGLRKNLGDFDQAWEDLQYLRQQQDTMRTLLTQAQNRSKQKDLLDQLAQQLSLQAQVTTDALDQAISKVGSLNQELSKKQAEYAEHKQAYQLRLAEVEKAAIIAAYHLQRAEQLKQAAHPSMESFVPKLEFLWAILNLAQNQKEGLDLPEIELAAHLAQDQLILSAAQTRSQQQFDVRLNWFAQERDRVAATHQQLQTTRDNLISVQEEIQALTSKRWQLQLAIANAQEVGVTDDILALTTQFARAQTKLTSLQGEQQAIEAQQALALELQQLQATQAQTRLQEDLITVEKTLASLEEKLEKKQSAFFGWLESRYPGWQKTIGKVVKDQLLFDSHLNPNVVRLNDLLYGIHLDLSEIEEMAPTSEELFQQKKELEAKKTELQRQLEGVINQQEKQQATLERRYRQRLRQVQKSVQTTKSQVEQVDLQIKKINAQSKQQPQKIAAQQQDLKIAYQLEDLRQKEQKLTKQMSDLLATLLPQKPEETTQFQEQLTKIEEAYLSAEKAARQTKQELLASWTKAQTKTGKSDHSLARIQTWIQQEQLTNNDQEQAHKQYIDHVTYVDAEPYWQQKATQTQLGLQGLTQQFEADTYRLKQEIDTLTQEIEIEETNIKQKTEALHRWQELQKGDWGVSLMQPEMTEQAVPTQAGFQELMSQFLLSQAQQQALTQQLIAGLVEWQHKLLHPGRFQLPSDLPNEANLPAWIKKLGSLASEEGRQPIEEKLGEQYASLVHQVVDATAEIMQWSERLHQRVEEVNQWFSNSEGLPFDISLQMRSVPSPWFTALNALHRFTEAHGPQIGAASLFNQTVAGDVNREAVSLLGTFSTELAHWAVEYLTPSDILDVEVIVEASTLASNHPAMQRLQQLWLTLALLIHAPGTQALNLFPIKEIDHIYKVYLLAWLDAASRANMPLLVSSTHGLGAAFFSTIYQIHANGKTAEVRLLKQQDGL